MRLISFIKSNCLTGFVGSLEKVFAPISVMINNVLLSDRNY